MMSMLIIQSPWMRARRNTSSQPSWPMNLVSLTGWPESLPEEVCADYTADIRSQTRLACMNQSPSCRSVNSVALGLQVPI